MASNHIATEGPEPSRRRWPAIGCCHVRNHNPRVGAVTGPEHYVAAEEILSRCSQGDSDSPLALARLVRAQVDATLANAAAAAPGDRDFRAWLDMAGSSSAGA
jgi:hypothetical protein